MLRVKPFLPSLNQKTIEVNRGGFFLNYEYIMFTHILNKHQRTIHNIHHLISDHIFRPYNILDTKRCLSVDYRVQILAHVNQKFYDLTAGARVCRGYILF